MREALQREAACCRYEVSTARGSGRVSDSLTVSSRGTPLLSNGIQSHDPPVTAGGTDLIRRGAGEGARDPSNNRSNLLRLTRHPAAI